MDELRPKPMECFCYPREDAEIAKMRYRAYEAQRIDDVMLCRSLYEQKVYQEALSKKAPLGKSAMKQIKEMDSRLKQEATKRSQKLQRHQVQSLKKAVEDSIQQEASDAAGNAVKEGEKQRRLQERKTHEQMVAMRRAREQQAEADRLKEQAARLRKEELDEIAAKEEKARRDKVAQQERLDKMQAESERLNTIRKQHEDELATKKERQRIEMEARDEERTKAMAEARKEMKQEREEQAAQAQKRINDAIADKEARISKARHDYYQRQDRVTKALHDKHLQKLREKEVNQWRVEGKNRRAMAKLNAVRKREADHQEDIRQQHIAAEERLNGIEQRKMRDRHLQQVEKELRETQKQRVMQQRKMAEEYRVSCLEANIREEEARLNQLKASKQMLLTERKKEQLEAKKARDKLEWQLHDIRVSNKFESLSTIPVPGLGRGLVALQRSSSTQPHLGNMRLLFHAAPPR